MKIKRNERVLDIGTNNGALLAMANTYAPKSLIGIDIQEKAVELARYNMKHLHILNAQILLGDVKDMKMPKVDVVVANPPYFPDHATSAKNETEALRIARHEIYLTLPTLVKKASEALDEKGRFYLVHRSDRLIDIVTTLRTYRLETRSIQFVYDENKAEAITVLIEAIKDGMPNCHILKPIYKTRS